MRAELIAFGIAFAVLSLGAAPAQAWLDAGELAAAGYELGVMHPPGMPGLVATLQLASLVPLGPLGWRMALVSTAAAALAAALTLRLLARRGVHPLVRWGAVAWLCCGLTFVRHAHGVEIYAPALAALALVADGLDPAREPATRLQPQLVATFVATWAIWSFGELRLSLPPVLLVLWLSALRRGRPYAAWAPIAVVLGSACVLTLPLSSARGPASDWGDPQQWSTMIDHLLARSIREAYATDMFPRSAAMWLAHAEGAWTRLSEDLGPSGPVLAAMALAWAALAGAAKRERFADPATLLVLGWWLAAGLLFAIAINPMGGADRQTGLLPAWCAIVMVALAVDHLLRPRPRLRLATLPLLWTVMLLPAALRSWPDAAAMRSWGPHAWTRGALAQLPPSAVLLTQSDDLSAGVAWARAIEGARPDVLSWPAQHLHKSPPDRIDPVFAPLWRAVAVPAGEAARIEAAIAAAPGTVALEHAHTGLFATVRFRGRSGALPLSLSDPRGPPPQPAPDVIARWLPLLPAAADRHRLAIAIAEWARASVRRGGDLGEAAAALQSSLLELDPEHAGAMITLGSIFDRMGDDVSAIEWTLRALELDPTRQAALLNLALYLGRDPSRHAEALATCERAIALRPDRPEPWLRLAELHEAAGALEAAGSARARAQALGAASP
ncbi:MAG: DUF2723 domain-containing protein [Nannocystaceae bacterium]|nr:DUF2723 domain-containing protein [Nannocystaceae bacterium]